MVSTTSGWCKRAGTSVLGLTTGLLVSTFVVSSGARVVASALPSTTGSVLVIVAQALTTPTGSIVSGAVNILGTATSGLDVAGIQFKINGQNVGPEVTSGVCGVKWDTTGGPDGSYVVSAVVRDTSSNFVTSAPVTVTVMNSAPQISSVMATVLSPQSVSITWKTNQQASTQVYFDAGAGSAYGSSTTADYTLTTAHSQTLSGLAAETTYRFRVESRNAAGVVAISGELTFNTSPVTSSAPLMSLDTPGSNMTMTVPFDVGGWALDRNSMNGTGVDAVHVWAFPTDGSPGTFVGIATYGGTRADVGGIYGSKFTNSGFGLHVRQLQAGRYQLTAFAHNSRTGTFNDARNTTITIQEPAQIQIDSLSNGATVRSPFRVSGWAIDITAPTGTGVDAVHVWAYPQQGGSPMFVGIATLGGVRNDIGALFGSQFTNAGFDLPAALADGSYKIVAYRHRASTGQFDQIVVRNITVNTPAPLAMAIDAVISQPNKPLYVQGWALDSRSPIGSGVDVVHVWAFPVGPGSPVFVGMLTVGSGPDRPDIGQIYGSRFHVAGFAGSPTGGIGAALSPGTYNVTVFAHSIATGKFDQAMSVRITR